MAAGNSQDTLSVALDLGSDGTLQHFHFCRSQVQVDGVLDPKGLSALLARKPKARTTPAALKGLKEHLPLLEQLQSLVECLRQQRLENGGLELDLPVPPLEPLAELAPGLPDQRWQGWLPAWSADQPLHLSLIHI